MTRTRVTIRKEAERAALAQRDQLARLVKKESTLQKATVAADGENSDQAGRLDDLESQAEEMEARLLQSGAILGPSGPDDGTSPHEPPIDGDLLPSEIELQEIRARLPDLSLNLDLTDAGGDWDAFVREVDAYIGTHGIDVDQDPLTQLLPAGSAAEVIRQFDQDYGPTPWDKWDWGVLGFAVLAGSLLDYFLVATPGNAFKGVPQRGSPVTSWLREQSEKLAPMAGSDGLQRNAFQQWVAGLTTKAEDWAKVPYDVVKPKIGLTPNTHRVASPGHDPGLGLVFGAKDIITGNCSFIDADGRWRVIQGGSASEEGVLQALVKVVVHGFSDVFTHQGLPPPFLSALQALKVNSGFALREGGDPVSVPNLIRYMYSNGYDLRHFATMAIVPGFAELTIRIYRYVRTAAEGEALGKDSIRDRLKLSQMLMLTHSLLASGNIVKTALYGWNPTALNYAQFLALGKQMLSLVKLSSERNVLIQRQLAEGWEELLSEAQGQVPE